MRVFSAQRRGQFRNGAGGTTTVSGNTLTFNPSASFNPGETIWTTITPSAQSTGGLGLARAQVYQFTTQVGGSGRGNFIAPDVNPNPSVSDGPQSVVLGDVDGDGDLDMLTVNSNSDNVSVRLNNGLGNFTTPATNPNPAVGDGPQDMVLGDVDGDGDLDLLTANYNSDNVSIRLNNGSGSFTAPATNPNPAVGDAPQSVALGDVDGDGDLDLLTANYRSANVSVRLNNGSGNFTAPTTNPNPSVSDGPRRVVLGDVDGDGDLDLLTANSNNSDNVSVRLNNGSGNFTAPTTNPNPPVGDSPFGIVLGDVDGDRDLDLLTANIYSNSVSVRLNNGTGSFTPPATNPNPGVGVTPSCVTLGDVDGDGDLDFIASNQSSNYVSVRLNNGSGNFTPPAINFNPGAGTIPSGVALGDLDGDGDLDMVVSNYGSDNVSVRLNQAAPPTITGFSASPNPVMAGQPVTFTATVGNVTGSYAYTLSSGAISSITGTSSTSAFSQSLTASGSGRQGFQLWVIGNQQLNTAITSLTVGSDTPPVATPNANQTALVGVPFSYTVNAFTSADPSNSLTYSASLEPANGLSFDPLTRIISGTPLGAVVSNVRITVTNVVGLESTTSFIIKAQAVSTLISVKTGYWEDPTTWNLNRLPTKSDAVIVDESHTVTLLGTGQAQTLIQRPNARLKLASSSTRLLIGF
ncbi:hypothetical protein GCM10028807_14590 [Spirosoma daeguense]